MIAAEQNTDFCANGNKAPDKKSRHIPFVHIYRGYPVTVSAYFKSPLSSELLQAVPSFGIICQNCGTAHRRDNKCFWVLRGAASFSTRETYDSFYKRLSIPCLESEHPTRGETQKDEQAGGSGPGYRVSDREC